MSSVCFIRKRGNHLYDRRL